MDELLNILNEINPDIDYMTETNLIDGKMIDSFSIFKLIDDICETFDIDIGPKWMRNENFNSVHAMWDMIQAIQNEDE
ncbi:MAG: acyl carrier protein [Clostridiales bacterium]|nr:acyl carrier protein [Clostridiales bacterium]